MLAHILRNVPLRSRARVKQCGVSRAQRARFLTFGGNDDFAFDHIDGLVLLEVPVEAAGDAIPDPRGGRRVETLRPSATAGDRIAFEYPCGVDRINNS